MCYKTVITDPEMSDSDFTTRETSDFTEQDDCDDDVARLPSHMDQKLCTAKFISKQNSEIFCWADPRNRTGWLQHQFSEKATHMLYIFSPRD